MKKPLNIVLYVPSFLPKTIGGRELVVHYLAKSYQELGHKVRVVGPAGKWSLRKFKFDYPLHRWFGIKGISREKFHYAQLLLDLAIYGCDILHVHSTYPPGYITSKMKKLKNIPFILTPHGADIHMVPEVGYGLRLDPEVDKKIRQAVAGADLLTAISASVEASLLSAGADAGKIRYIPNGVDLDRFSGSALTKAEVCARLGFPEDARLIITIGRYEPRKGQDVLIRAMPKILEQDSRARLVIVGQKIEVLNEVIDELGLQDKVRLAGTLKPPNIVHSSGADFTREGEPDWLVGYCRHSSVYVSASIDEGAEGLSLALLEGMAAGLPIVATNISGNKDVVIDDYNGYIVEPGSHEALSVAISRVLDDENRVVEMGKASEEIISAYGWKAVAGKYLEQYFSVLQGTN